MRAFKGEWWRQVFDEALHLSPIGPSHHDYGAK